MLTYNPESGRYGVVDHGKPTAYRRCDCARCRKALKADNKKRTEATQLWRKQQKELFPAEDPFKPAKIGGLLRDILETNHWQSWTTDLLTAEVARIRRVDADDRLRESVRCALAKIVRTDEVVRGETVVVSYRDEDAFGRQRRQLTARWKESA